MRITAISSTVMCALLTGPFILVEGIRPAIPLLISLILGIIWTVISE